MKMRKKKKINQIKPFAQHLYTPKMLLISQSLHNVGNLKRIVDGTTHLHTFSQHYTQIRKHRDKHTHLI